MRSSLRDPSWFRVESEHSERTKLFRKVVVLRNDQAVLRVADRPSAKEILVANFSHARPIILPSVIGVIAPPKVLPAASYRIRLAHLLHNGSFGLAPLNLLKFVASPRIHSLIHGQKGAAYRNRDEGRN